jgi:hypothetical protein
MQALSISCCMYGLVSSRLSFVSVAPFLICQSMSNGMGDPLTTSLLQLSAHRSAEVTVLKETNDLMQTIVQANRKGTDRGTLRSHKCICTTRNPPEMDLLRSHVDTLLLFLFPILFFPHWLNDVRYLE